MAFVPFESFVHIVLVNNMDYFVHFGFVFGQFFVVDLDFDFDNMDFVVGYNHKTDHIFNYKGRDTRMSRTLKERKSCAETKIQHSQK